MQQKSIKFNEEIDFTPAPSGGISVIPYYQNKVTDDPETKNYTNKLFDENVYAEGAEKIKLNPDRLNNYRKRLAGQRSRNEQIFTQTYTSYINVDSNQRVRLPVNNYDQILYNLPPFPLIFKNGSSIVTVNLENHPFQRNDRVILDNVSSKNVMLRNVIMVKKNSTFVRVKHENHGLSLFGLYDPSDISAFESVEYVDYLPESYSKHEDIPDTTTQYYILRTNSEIDLTIQLSGVKGSNATKTKIGNIPVNILNDKQIVYLLFTKSSATEFAPDKNSYLIRIPIKSNINYQDGNDGHNNVLIKYYNLFGVPLNYINRGTPINECRKFQYFTVLDVTDNTFQIDVGYNAIYDITDPTYSFYDYSDAIYQDIDIKLLINNFIGGGSQAYTRRIEYIITGYPNPNQYQITLDKSYKNVIQARIISSTFPNSQRMINNQTADVVNNRLYWRNLEEGDHIYHLEVTPGNYTYEQLAKEIEQQFNDTIRHTSQIQNSSKIKYDRNGHYRYHIVKVTINTDTDIVEFSAFREIRQQDTLEIKILSIPDSVINFTAAENFQINFGLTGTQIVPQIINPFDPKNGELMYIYFTPNTHIRINIDYPYANYNLYRYTSFIGSSTATSKGNNTFRTKLETDRALLFNFYRTKSVYPDNVSTQELNSLNTTTLLQNFSFDYINAIVTMADNDLHIGDLIITDQFIYPSTPTELFVYEITTIIDLDTFIVKKYPHGNKYKFIYDGIIINFSPDGASPYYWLDQIIATDPILPLPPNKNHNTLSFIDITPTDENKITMRVHQPNHMLNIDDQIRISGSESINNVPAEIINTEHYITQIIDDDNYEVEIETAFPVISVQTLNTVTIRYPDIFQMFFNYPDTLGEKLSFNKVGQVNAITPYLHTIKNTTPYKIDYDYGSLGDDYIQRLKKLDMTGPDYFYITSPELGIYHNTRPVIDVFAKVRWENDLQFTDECCNTNNVIIDSFVPTISVFDNPISVLYELNLAFYHPDGRLVEFNGIDHSFTIEIIEVFNQPDETDINVRINSEMIVRRTE